MTSRCIGLTVLLVLGLAVAAPATMLHANVPVSDNGTSNSIAYPNTSRNVATAPDGTIYVAYYNPSGIWVARSTNRGQSFQTSVQINTSSHECEITVDADGVVYVVWVQDGQATLCGSTDSGTSFSTPSSIGSASGTVHMAVDAPYVYIIAKNGTTLFHNSNSGTGAFNTTTVDSTRAYSDVHVDSQTGDLYVQTDDPTVRMFKSTDHGATFDGPHTNNDSIYYSTTVLASTGSGVFLYTCGNGSTALRTDMSDYSATTLTFGTTSISQGRTLAVDAFGNVIDGYVDGSDVKYAISADNGASFDTAVTIASASYLSLALNRRYGDIVAVYQQGGEIFCTVYRNEIIQAPTIDTAPVSDITAVSASCGGDVVVNGGDNVIARGVCWSTSANPTTSDNKTSDGTGTGSFTSNITGLSAGTTYHVRAYATNSVGTAYGQEVSFTTTDVAVVPSVTTASVSDVTATAATAGGNVTSNGGASITARGVCWSTSASPTTSDSKTTDGTGTGSFTSELTSLSSSTTYYLRAYATNSVGTAYGQQETFSTSATMPTVTTTSASNITTTSAESGGNVTSNGGASITARGVCWSTSENPTTSDNKTSDGTGTGSFASDLTELSPGTTYYIRAYATNSEGTAYGQETSFTTTDLAVVPSVTTASVSDVTATAATAGGNVTSNGGASITARGVCWSTSQNPTTSDNKTSDGTGTGSFTSELSGLTRSTTYYIRAYATNSVGTAYGSYETFNTLATTPTVTTASVSDVTATAATAGGNVTSNGGASITTRGLCWSTSENPTTSNNKTSDGTGTGSFASDLTELSPGTTYYIRAYATNSVGTAYGQEVSFTPDAASTQEIILTEIITTQFGCALPATLLLLLITLSFMFLLPNRQFVGSTIKTKQSNP